MPRFESHGSGKFKKSLFAKIGQNVIFESGVLVFHPENIEIGSNVYLGANTILEGYHTNKLIIKDRVWIGPQAYLHAAGGITIESDSGIGPGSKILTSVHDLSQDDLGPIINLPLKYAPVKIESRCDIGTGAIILPGVTIAEGTQVGAGAVVTKNTDRYWVVAGVPAKFKRIRRRPDEYLYPPKKVFKISTVLTSPSRYLFDGLFLLIFPLAVIYSWLRLILKKLFKIKPLVIFSPLASPLPLFAVKAIRTQGYKADNLAYDCSPFFRPISFGLVLLEQPILRKIALLTDYLAIFAWALLKYDFFEFCFSGGILMNSHLRKAEFLLLKLSAKKISVYGYGSDCKILSDIRKMGFKYNNAMDRAEETESQTEKTIRENVARAKKYADVLIAGGDLIHFGQKGIMLPLASDLSLWKYARPNNHQTITIVHSTNHRSHKGTRFILEIFDSIKEKLPIKMLLIEKKTMEECQKIYPKANFFITDVITGWHGFTAIEAMAIGRPVITYLRPDIMKFHAYYAKGRIPAISANPDTLARAITKLVKDRKFREELGERGRQYALKFHSLEFVGALRAIIYEFIWLGKKINQKIFEKEVKKRKLI